MINEELYINGVLVDLKGPSQIALTFQANNIAELQSRQQDFSNVFQLPKTPKNRSVFEFADNMNSSTLVPYRTLSVRYLIDGVDQVLDGVGRLVRPTNTDYHVQVTSGNASYFSIVGGLKISEILGSSLDHLNTFANVTGSRANTSGYIYPFIDWMQDGIETEFVTSSVDARRLLPCVFIKTIIEKADEIAGFESYGAFKALPDFNNLILTPNSLERSKSVKDQYSKSYTSNSADINFTPTFSPPNVLIPLTNDVNENFFTAGAFSPDARAFGFFQASGVITFSGGASSSDIAFQFWNNTTNSLVYQEIVSFAHPSTPTTKAFNVVSSNVSIEPTDEIVLLAGYVSAIGSPTIKWHAGNKFSFSLFSTLPYNGFMPVGELFEDITYGQLCQDLFNMYAVTPIANNLQKRIRFGLFDELTANIGVAKDWSKKLHGSGFEASYTFGKYAQDNALKYKELESVPKFYGDSSFQVDDANLPQTLTAVQLNTSATQDELRFQGLNYPRIKALDTARVLKSTNNRILLLDRKASTSYSHSYTDGTNSLNVSANVPYCTFRPLDFSLLKEGFYGTLLGMLVKTKAPAYVFRLTPQDTQELDYLIPIYLDIHEDDIDVTGYFYLNQVANYVNGFATCTLVRL